jgi:hypothetical protein
MQRKIICSYVVFVLNMVSLPVFAQVKEDSNNRVRKNIIRYNLTGALFFGADKYIVLGYERIVSPRQSFSINMGNAALPKLTSLITDSFQTQKQIQRKGFNASVDYRFYLSDENKFDAPRGIYIGPYYSYNQFENEQEWEHIRNSTTNSLTTRSKFRIHTVGFEVGYQFIFWKRLAIDLVMIGPGLGFYKYKATFDSNVNLSPEGKQQLFNALQQLLVQKFPGMNYVFDDKFIDANGSLQTKAIGYRYIAHIGYNF